MPSALPAAGSPDRLGSRAYLGRSGQAAGGRFGPRRPGRDRRRRVPPGRRAPRRRPARTARDDPGPARRRHLPGDRGRRGLDPAAAPPPDARRAEDIQAAGHAGAPRPPGGRARGAAGDAAGPAQLPADQLPRVRWRGLPGILFPRRGHEHRSVPPPARRLAVRPGPAGEGDRARRAPRLLRQRHPPKRDPGRRRPGRGVLAEHQRHERPGARHLDHHRQAHDSRAGGQRRGGRPDARPGRRPGSGAGTARS